MVSALSNMFGTVYPNHFSFSDNYVIVGLNYMDIVKPNMANMINNIGSKKIGIGHQKSGLTSKDEVVINIKHFPDKYGIFGSNLYIYTWHFTFYIFKLIKKELVPLVGGKDFKIINPLVAFFICDARIYQSFPAVSLTYI